MRRDRVEKLRGAMTAAGVDVLILCGQNNVSYATGARVPAADHLRASGGPPVVVFERAAPWPHLYTESHEGAPSDIPSDCLHGPIEVETAEGAAELVAQLPSGVVAIDDAPFPLWERIVDRAPLDA